MGLSQNFTSHLVPFLRQSTEELRGHVAYVNPASHMCALSGAALGRRLEAAEELVRRELDIVDIN